MKHRTTGKRIRRGSELLPPRRLCRTEWQDVKGSPNYKCLIGGEGRNRTGSGKFFKIHFSAITTPPPPEANSLITNECQWDQAFLLVCQAPAITHQIPINYSPITNSSPVPWHFHWH